MTKYVRIPLTDTYDRDISTWKVVKLPRVRQSVGVKKRIAKWLSIKRQEAKKQGKNDGSILVDWLGRVKL